VAAAAIVFLRAQEVIQAATITTFIVLAPKAKELDAFTAVTASAFMIPSAQAETQMASASTLVKPMEDGKVSHTATATTLTAGVAQGAQVVSANFVILPKAKVLTAAVTAESVTSDSLTATAVAKGVSGDCSGTCVCGTECTCSMSVEGLAKVVHVLIAPALMTAMEAAAMVTASELKKQPPALAMIVTTVALWK